MKRMKKVTIKTKRKPKIKKVGQSTLAKRTRDNQNMFLNALIRNNYHITNTCEKTGIPRMTYYDWTRKNPKFKAKLEALRELEIDNIEDAFRDLVEERNPQVVMFGLKTRGKHRGYIEKQEIEHTGITGINISFGEPVKPEEMIVEEEKPKIEDKTKE